MSGVGNGNPWSLGWGSYVCDVCGACFPEPNPLKAHLFLRCAAPAPARFWRELLARLTPPPATATGRKITIIYLLYVPTLF